ncbi:MAG: SagB/ThcOx family dehydrogenase [Gallionella sp.]|nr:SagB/ThcOx family dehydrogenase [Gallionella sp.]
MMKTLLPILAVFMVNFAAAAEAGTGPAAQGISLPPPPSAGTVSLEDALARRRSVREFAPGALTLAEVSRLAWAAQGVTAPERRTAPSAGATYPLEVYLVAGDVENLAAGVYRYRPDGHRLELVADGDIRLPLADAALGQTWISKAAMVVVIAAVFERTTSHYGKRGERYVHMEAGHAAQSLLLQAAALGLGARPVGAFNDLGVSHLLRLPGGEVPLYLIPVGKTPRF